MISNRPRRNPLAVLTKGSFGGGASEQGVFRKQSVSVVNIKKTQKQFIFFIVFLFSLRFFQNKVLQKNDQVCPPPGCTWQARRMQTLKQSFPARTDAICLADQLTIYAVSVYTYLLEAIRPSQTKTKEIFIRGYKLHTAFTCGILKIGSLGVFLHPALNGVRSGGQQRLMFDFSCVKSLVRMVEGAEEHFKTSLCHVAHGRFYKFTMYQ